MEIGKEIKRRFPEAKVIKIRLKHTRTVNRYVMQIEEAHKRAAKSKLHFGG